MNRNLGLSSSLVAFVASLGFLITLANRVEFLISLSGLIMSFGFVILICTYSIIQRKNSQTAAFSAITFATASAVIFSFVYLPELTVLRAQKLVDFPYLKTSLSFRHLGYFNFYLIIIAIVLLSFAIFFVCFTIAPNKDEQRIILKIVMILQISIAAMFIAAAGFEVFALSDNGLVARTLMFAWSGAMGAIAFASYLHFLNYDY